MALAPGVLPAQTADPEAPPPVLNVYREELKSGKMTAHERMGSAWNALFSKANPEVAWLGLTPVAGDDGVVLYLEGFPSFAAAEASRNKTEAALNQNAAWKAEMDRLDSQSAELRNSSRTSFWVYRPAMSYHPPKMSDVAKSRLASISTIRVKPGRVPDFQDYYKALNAARDKANASWVSTATYQSQVGAPSGTFIIFSFSKALAEMDEGVAKGDERQKAIDAALGGDMVVKMRRELISEILVEPVTTNLYALNRSESHPTAQFAAYDSDYWTPKAAVPSKALATKKEAPKP